MRGEDDTVAGDAGNPMGARGNPMGDSGSPMGGSANPIGGRLADGACALLCAHASAGNVRIASTAIAGRMLSSCECNAAGSPLPRLSLLPVTLQDRFDEPGACFGQCPFELSRQLFGRLNSRGRDAKPLRQAHPVQ